MMIALLATALAAALPLEPAGSVYADEKGGALRNPEGVACTGSGTVVAADTGNGRLVIYTFRDGALRGGAVVRVPELGNPVRVQINSRGDVLSLDLKARRIACIGAGGAFLGFLEMKGVPPAHGFFPVSFKLGAQDQAFVLDAQSQRVVVVDAAGAFVRQVELPKGGSITDIALDEQGTLYAVDAVKAVLYVAGKRGFTPLTKALKDYLSFAGYLTVTAQGPIVLVDQNGNGLVVLGRDGSYLGRRLGIGWTEGSVYYPGQVCIDAKGNAFVADRANQRIQAFSAPK